MKRKLIFLSFMVFAAASAYAQTREDITVHILPVRGNPTQAAFFKENFEMEVTAAGYALTANANAADYLMQLEVTPNMITYDNGTVELAPPDEKQYILTLTLIRGEDNAEVVVYSFAFTELDEMYEHNLYLVYGAMANVPITKLGDVEVIDESDRWRNKWLYLRVSVDYPYNTTYQLKPDGLTGGSLLSDRPDPLNDPTAKFHQLDHMVRVWPGASISLEVQFLNWMSAELGFLLRLGDPYGGTTFIPGIQAQLKFPLKPFRYLMLEPYILGIVQRPLESYHFVHYPPIAVGGGFQFGVKGGEMGAFFIDVNFAYSIDDVITKNQDTTFKYPEQIHWQHWALAIGFGYKIGFFDRLKAPSTPAK